ncbi:MAG: hypothetical protein ACTHJ8_11660 [Mucilaginibacter sp.]
MKRKALITAALLCFITVCLAAVAGGLPGKWLGTVQTPDGDVDLTYNFKLDGNKLSGTAESQGHEVTIDSGKVSGDNFTFRVTNSEGVVIPHEGKYFTTGDSCSLNIDYQGTKFHTTLKRVAEK